jgi:hypothetical protein
MALEGTLENQLLSHSWSSRTQGIKRGGGRLRKELQRRNGDGQNLKTGELYGLQSAVEISGFVCGQEKLGPPEFREPTSHWWGNGPRKPCGELEMPANHTRLIYHDLWLVT